jgi:hypothetical protein
MQHSRRGNIRCCIHGPSAKEGDESPGKGQRKNQLISMIIWRSILVQKTISFIIKKMKKTFMVTDSVGKTEEATENENEPANENTDLEAPMEPINANTDLEAPMEQPGTRKPPDKTNIRENEERDKSDKALKRKGGWKAQEMKGNWGRNQHKKQKK